MTNWNSANHSRNEECSALITADVQQLDLIMHAFSLPLISSITPVDSWLPAGQAEAQSYWYINVDNVQFPCKGVVYGH